MLFDRPIFKYRQLQSLYQHLSVADFDECFFKQHAEITPHMYYNCRETGFVLNIKWHMKTLRKRTWDEQFTNIAFFQFRSSDSLMCRTWHTKERYSKNYDYYVSDDTTEKSYRNILFVQSVSNDDFYDQLEEKFKGTELVDHSIEFGYLNFEKVEDYLKVYLDLVCNKRVHLLRKNEKEKEKENENEKIRNYE
tara:strand:+ start:322 stop:900 length:579 start_codon:yes stop_codon:yes gene_type:complete